jgi:hypothetical protein
LIEPHFVTWYGSHFSYQGACDLVFIHNSLFGNGIGLDLHIRLEHMMSRAYSFVSNVALKIGDDVLEIISDGSHYVNGVKGVELPTSIGGPIVSKSVKETCRGVTTRQQCWYSLEFDIELNYGDHIYVKVASGMLHVNVFGSLYNFEGSTGVMGTYPSEHHGKIARDGITYIREPDTFAEEWQVLSTEPKLFNENRFPQHPELCTPAVIPTKNQRNLRAEEAERHAAEEACAHVTGKEWEFCVFDVMATGDYGIAAAIYGDF